jgi:hypothetical protein
MLDAVHPVDQLSACITDAQHIVEALFNADENVLVNCRTEHTTALGVEKGRKIRTPSEKADAQRCLHDNQNKSPELIGAAAGKYRRNCLE